MLGFGPRSHAAIVFDCRVSRVPSALAGGEVLTNEMCHIYVRQMRVSHPEKPKASTALSLSEAPSMAMVAN